MSAGAAAASSTAPATGVDAGAGTNAHEAIRCLQALQEEVALSIRNGDVQKLEQFRARYVELTGRLPSENRARGE